MASGVMRRRQNTVSGSWFLAFIVEAPTQSPKETQYRREIAEWEKSIASTPGTRGDSYAYYQLGTLHKLLGNHLEAVKAFEEYLKLEPKGMDADAARKYIASQKRIDPAGH
jgi:hypothetical protein